MLQQLHISNYALIDELSVSFESGFNVITGETGAGKCGAVAYVFTDIIVEQLHSHAAKRSRSDVLQKDFESRRLSGFFETSCPP